MKVTLSQAQINPCTQEPTSTQKKQSTLAGKAVDFARNHPFACAVGCTAVASGVFFYLSRLPLPQLPEQPLPTSPTCELNYYSHSLNFPDFDFPNCDLEKGYLEAKEIDLGHNFVLMCLECVQCNRDDLQKIASLDADHLLAANTVNSFERVVALAKQCSGLNRYFNQIPICDQVIPKIVKVLMQSDESLQVEALRIADGCIGSRFSGCVQAVQEASDMAPAGIFDDMSDNKNELLLEKLKKAAAARPKKTKS